MKIEFHSGCDTFMKLDAAKNVLALLMEEHSRDRYCKKAYFYVMFLKLRSKSARQMHLA